MPVLAVKDLRVHQKVAAAVITTAVLIKANKFGSDKQILEVARKGNILVVLGVQNSSTLQGNMEVNISLFLNIKDGTITDSGKHRHFRIES